VRDGHAGATYPRLDHERPRSPLPLWHIASYRVRFAAVLRAGRAEGCGASLGLGPAWSQDCLLQNVRVASLDMNILFVGDAGSVKQAKAVAIRKLHVTAATGAPCILPDSASTRESPFMTMVICPINAHVDFAVTLQAM